MLQAVCEVKKADLRNRYRKQRGQIGGLTELQIAGLIAALVVASAVAYGYSTLSTSKAQSEWRLVDGLAAAVRTHWQGQIYPAASLNASLVSNKLVGSLRNDGVSVIYNSYGQTITVTGASSNFTISDPGLASSDCSKVLMSVPGSGYLSVSVNGGATLTTFPVDDTTANTQCAGAANTIVFTAQ